MDPVLLTMSIRDMVESDVDVNTIARVCRFKALMMSNTRKICGIVTQEVIDMEEAGGYYLVHVDVQLEGEAYAYSIMVTAGESDLVHFFKMQHLNDCAPESCAHVVAMIKQQCNCM